MVKTDQRLFFILPAIHFPRPQAVLPQPAQQRFIGHGRIDGLCYFFYGKLIEEHSDLSLILLDLNLPKVDGFDVLRRLRASEKCKDVPVIVITSSDSPADRSQAASLGAGYFRKPPSYEEYLKLGAVLRQLLKDHR